MDIRWQTALNRVVLLWPHMERVQCKHLLGCGCGIPFDPRLNQNFVCLKECNFETAMPCYRSLFTFVQVGYLVILILVLKSIWFVEDVMKEDKRGTASWCRPSLSKRRTGPLCREIVDISTFALRKCWMNNDCLLQIYLFLAGGNTRNICILWQRNQKEHRKGNVLHDTNLSPP